MNKLLVGVLFISLPLTAIGQNDFQKSIITKFIRAHNEGTEEAVEEFIKETYHPSVYSQLDIQKQFEFYNQIIKEFGALNNIIYEVIQETKTKAIVYLIKKDESLMNKNIDPAEILVVEVDLSPENPKFLARGLGLGALICEIKKN